MKFDMALYIYKYNFDFTYEVCSQIIYPNKNVEGDDLQTRFFPPLPFYIGKIIDLRFKILS